MSLLTAALTAPQVILDFALGPTRRGFHFPDGFDAAIHRRLLDGALVAAYCQQCDELKQLSALQSASRATLTSTFQRLSRSLSTSLTSPHRRRNMVDENAVSSSEMELVALLQGKGRRRGWGTSLTWKL